MVEEPHGEPRRGPRPVVTAFLEHSGRILLLRRSPAVRSFPGRWAAVSGSIPAGVTLLEQGYQEVLEEVGLGRDQLELVGDAPPMLVRDGVGSWLVFPVWLRVRNPALVRLNWENTEWRWVTPSAMVNYPTVPRLREAWEAVQRCALSGKGCSRGG